MYYVKIFFLKNRTRIFKKNSFCKTCQIIDKWKADKSDFHLFA